MLSVVGGEVTINGITYSGSAVVIEANGTIIVDGRKVTVEQGKTLNVTITGNPQNVKTTSGDIRIYGAAGTVESVSGDITCGSVAGGVSSISGDIDCMSVMGSVSSISGDISHKNT